MKFIYNDGGRAAAGFKGAAGDCVTRAIAIAAELDYRKVYDALSEGCRSERRIKMRNGRAVLSSTARLGVRVQRKWFKDYMDRLGWEFVATMGIGTGCRVHLVDGELPMGRLIVSVSKHYVAVIDGVIHDTHDPSERGATIYPPTYPMEYIPKGARILENGNGWVYEPKRCVYGYWKKR